MKVPHQPSERDDPRVDGDPLRDAGIRRETPGRVGSFGTEFGVEGHREEFLARERR